MPICTTCTHWVPHLYTVYQSAYNLRLEQPIHQTNCHAFADPYVEHDTLTLLIDLILLKRGVYRHLLYNRGSPPRRADDSKNSHDEQVTEPQKYVTVRMLDEREWVCSLRKSLKWLDAVAGVLQARWARVLELGGYLVFLDAFIRWSHLHVATSSEVSPWSLETIADFTRIFIGCLAETIAFHSGVLFFSYLVLKVLDFVKSFKQRSPHKLSDIRREFRFSLIPLSLFYSSLTKLFLLFLLTVWRPSNAPVANRNTQEQSNVQSSPLKWSNNTLWSDSSILDALSFMNDDQLDRQWIVRNVLGGMSAGFGLRVILDVHPVFTTIVILFGWLTKTAMAELIGKWVASDEKTGEAWLAYSIP
ncbi:hypothetical protein D9758_003876 [Tetrapyrgos nigripes]|uniref:Protein ARV n=1 Tax=Tetrapyrgos nigripes TaxID=182062 RepID=A0A8H5GLV4_9AGAR|nr:hypothetical protein D9758_003876 [Tetrapyrgos nigripes]